MSQRFFSPLLTCALLASALLTAACGEQPYRHYQTHAEAVAAGETRRGWLPTWVPDSATDIHIQGDLDTNHFWLRFSLPPEAASHLKAVLVPVPPGQLATVPLGAPVFASWWFDSLIAREPANDGALNAEVFQGRGTPVASTTFIAFDRTTPRVFLWGRGRS
jgi:hypothetical protein